MKKTHLETVVDIQARDHHQESVSIDTAHKSFNDIGVPRLVGIVDQAVRCVRSQKRHCDDIQIAEGNFIILLSLLLSLGEFVLVFKHNHVRQEG